MTTGLRRRLSLRDLIVYGLLFIGPLAPVGVFGVLDARAGGAVGLVYLVATMAMAFTAWSYAEMSRVVPHAGSVFAYASAGLGGPAGFLAGWLAMLDYLLIPSVAYLFCGIATHALVPAVPAWVFTVVALAITTGCNLAGVAVAARVGFVVLVVEIVVFGAFVAVAGQAIADGHATRPLLSPFTGVTAEAWRGVPGAISVAVLSYLGFDAIASFAEETTGEPRQVGRAILVCLGIAGVLFVAQTWLAGVLAPFAPADLAARPERQGTAFYDLTRSFAPWLATLLAVTKAIGPAFAAMAGQAAASRLLYGMARDGRLPAALGHVDSASGTPRGALLAAAGLTLVVSVWAARRPDGLELLVSVVDIGALAAFALLHASVVGFFVVRRRAEPSWWHLAVPLAGAAVTLWVLAGAAPIARTLGLAWLAAGGLVMAARRWTGR